jgi:hypothetical protein
MLTSTRLLEQVRERIRYLHYSLRTEQAYVRWVRLFVRWSGLRHPRECGHRDVEAFLSFLANERLVAASTHRQALHALPSSTRRCWTWICRGCRRSVGLSLASASRSC